MARFNFILLASSLLLSSTTIASSVLPRQSDTPEYSLRTITADPLSNKNGLFVAGYHTGAGIDDAVLTADAEDASIGFLSDTHQAFYYGTLFPWSFSLVAAANYAAWEPVNINASQGTSGFRIEDSALIWGDSGSGFAGWMACDWSHGVPQLFWRNSDYKFPLPGSCADVVLEIVPLGEALDG